MDDPPSLEAFEYTAPDGSRWRYVRVAAPPAALPAERPADAPSSAHAPWWTWLAVGALAALWLAFLVHAWHFRRWWGPVRWPVEVAWVLGWIVTPLWVLSACLVGIGDAMRR